MSEGPEERSGTVTWRELVAQASAGMAELGLPEAEVAARWMGQQATGADGADWHDQLDEPANERQLARFDRMVERRCAGEPLQYVLGSWGFRSLDLMVDARVLIPRPETEIVAQHALDELARLRTTDPATVVVDLGTGSGAIGLAVATEHPGVEVWLTDASDDALQVARANLAGLGRHASAVRIAAGDWFEALPDDLAGRIGLVVSNPPYVADAGELEDQVRDWEPMSALLADSHDGVGGTADLVHLIDGAPRWLRPDGALVLEMAPDQVTPMAALARGRFDHVEVVVDLAGRDRAIVARHPAD